MTAQFDVSEVGALLHVVEKAGTHQSQLSYIRDAALARLNEINDSLGEEHAARQQEEAAQRVEVASGGRETNLETAEEPEADPAPETSTDRRGL